MRQIFHKCNVKMDSVLPDHVSGGLHNVWNLTNKWYFEEVTLILELLVGHLDHHLKCPKTQVAMHKFLKTTCGSSQKWTCVRQIPLILLLNLFIATSIPVIPHAVWINVLKTPLHQLHRVKVLQSALKTVMVLYLGSDCSACSKVLDLWSSTRSLNMNSV